jgi:hypothetical protein
MFEFGPGDPLAVDFLEEFASPCETGPHAVLVHGQGGHGHQAGQPDVGHGVKLLGQMNRRSHGGAVLLRFAGTVDLKQDIGVDSQFVGLGVDLFGQPERIDRMDRFTYLQRLLDLIPLQMADHVPMNLGRNCFLAMVFFEKRTHFIGNLLEVLDAVFAKIGESMPEDFLNRRQGRSFRNDNDFDVFSVGPGSDTGVVNVVLNLLQFVCDYAHGQLYRFTG